MLLQIEDGSMSGGSEVKRCKVFGSVVVLSCFFAGIYMLHFLPFAFVRTVR